MKTFILCKILKDHDWTSANQEGIPPTQDQFQYINSLTSNAQDQLDNSGVGFAEYAKMYCKRCGYVSKLSIELINRMKNGGKDTN